MNVRLTDDEMAEVKAHAWAMHVSPREWLTFIIRRALKAMKDKPKEVA